MASISGLQVFPKDHIESALKTVFQMNVMRFQGGFMGAVNGMRPDGQVSYIYCDFSMKAQFQNSHLAFFYSLIASADFHRVAKISNIHARRNKPHGALLFARA